MGAGVPVVAYPLVESGRYALGHSFRCPRVSLLSVVWFSSERMSDGGVVGAARAVLDRCAALDAVGGVQARLELVRGLEDLVLAAQVAQARVLAGLVVHEAAEFAPYAIAGPCGEPGTVPAAGAVTPQEVAACLDMSVESVRMRLAVADTLVGVLPAVSVAAEVGLMRWWQVRRTVEAVWGLPAGVVPALDARLGELAGQGRLRTRFGDTLSRLVISLDPELAERRLDAALVERAVRVRPDEVTPGMGVLIASLPAEGAIRACQMVCVRGLVRL